MLRAASMAMWAALPLRECPPVQIVPVSGGRLAEGAEGDGVAQALHRRDAVLPELAHVALQRVGGARRELQRATLPGVARPAAQAEGARCQQRHARDVAEDGAVLVPADGGAGR